MSQNFCGQKFCELLAKWGDRNFDSVALQDCAILSDHDKPWIKWVAIVEVLSHPPPMCRMSTMHPLPPSTIFSAYHSLSLPLRKSFAGLLTLTSSGWSLLVVLAGMVTVWILFVCNREKTTSVHCPLYTSKWRVPGG